jgi:hypothetical protein
MAGRLCYTIPMKVFVRVALGVFVLALAVHADAYVLPARQILTFMLERVVGGNTLVVSQKAVMYDSGLEGGMQEIQETLYFKYPGRFRSEMNAGGLRKVHVRGPDGVLVIMDDKIMGESEGPLDRFSAPFLHKRQAPLAQELAELGIDLGTVTLGRFEDKVAFVIGARYPDETVPQLWIEKDSFRPIRFIPGGRDGAPAGEIVYSDYRSVGKRGEYPARILFYERGNLVRMNVMESLEVNVEVDDALFDVTSLRNLYEPVNPSEPSEPASELDEVKKTIRDFRKIYE